MPDPAPRIGVVGTPGGWSTERLADAVAARTGTCLFIDLAKAELDLTARTAKLDGEDLAELDAVIVKKLDETYAPENLDRLEILRMLAARGVAVFSTPERVAGMVNRLACSVTLRIAGIPVPDTVATESVDVALATIRRFGTAVLKPLYSTKARGMCVVSADESDADDRVRAFAAENPMMYIQRKIALPGRDLGLVFVGGRYLATYARVAGGDSWNTTILAGGAYEPAEPAADIVALAERAQAPFGLDFTCVDVAETEDGPYVFEVSAFGGFRGLHDAHGIDGAAVLVDHVMDALARDDAAARRQAS